MSYPTPAEARAIMAHGMTQEPSAPTLTYPPGWVYETPGQLHAAVLAWNREQRETSRRPKSAEPTPP